MKKIIHKLDKTNYAYGKIVIRCEQSILNVYLENKHQGSRRYGKVNCTECLKLKGARGYS